MLLNDGAKRNRLPYLKIRIQPLEKSYICPNFLPPFAALKLIHLRLAPILPNFFAFFSNKNYSLLPPILSNFFAFFNIEIDSLTLKVITTNS